MVLIYNVIMSFNIYGFTELKIIIYIIKSLIKGNYSDCLISD